MLLSVFISVLWLSTICGGRVLLYDTENISTLSEKFDCIYVLDTVDGNHDESITGKVPYCLRRNFTEILRRDSNECENGGVKKYFLELSKENVQSFKVLEWSSSVEMADDYAAFYYNNYSEIESNENQKFLCHCTNRSTFGKYCEYQLTHEAKSFEASQRSQVRIREKVFFNHQQFGDIVCYITLSCNSGLLCLDWRDICDGEQQCRNGWDEENCDKLEFNECEEDEYRCNNGMCIPEEYWLDGDKDCMDWTDESRMKYEGAGSCFWEKTTIDCDEHICLQSWSCGDGQCIDYHDRLIFQSAIPAYIGCWNLRNMNHMCELAFLKEGWTYPNGLCWFSDSGSYDDPRLNINNRALSNEEKCIYLIRCLLSNGSELDCPCNRLNCSKIMPKYCDRTNQYYPYPNDSLIRPYLFTYYDWTTNFNDKIPHRFLVTGNIRCQGYTGFLEDFHIELSLSFIQDSRWDSTICSMSEINRYNASSIKYDSDCGKSYLTFNGRPYAFHDICTEQPKCISQYRINDGWIDCLWDEADEDVFNSEKDLCSRVRKHRFQCSSDQSTCLSISSLGDGFSQCSNNYDEHFYGRGRALSELKCHKSHPDNCQLVKGYIQNVTHSNTDQSQYESKNQISFRSYCDSLWNLPKHVDELSENCQNWICHRDQYQCQTGQCIHLDWVCDEQWDCTDASDEEALLTIHTWSPHNQQLKGLDEKLMNCGKLYSNLPFSRFCNTTIEFPCLRSNVSDPLNLEKNPPCISYSKIGDGIEDCYNAYDEKNTFADILGRMWGFTLRCDNFTTEYPFACQNNTDNCAQIFCPSRHYHLSNCGKPNDAVCINNSRCVPGGRCNGTSECSHGEDEYWCAPDHSGEQLTYRISKKFLKEDHAIFDQQTYPTFSSPILPQSPIKMTRDLSSSLTEYSFMCNKGVTVLIFNKFVCFCPPSYFGNTCQFFSDRITIITHLNLTTWPSVSMTMPTLFKIKVNFLFDEIIIDYYEFYSNPTIEIRNYIKHKFYLLYSRSTEMLSHKQTRFYNRTDIEINHPYSVHFDLYALYNNQSTPIALGSWHYPIYFDFLPSFRLATILRFPNWFSNSTLDPCINHTCNPNSTCQPIFNQNNSYFCSCKNGFYGKDCSKYEETCNSYCSPYSLCRPDDRSMITVTNHPFCICPLDYFGPRCYLKFQQCDTYPCWNNGSCIYTNESYGGDSFVCLCSKLFYGDQCQYQKMDIQIRLNTSMMIESPRATTIQFYDVNTITFELILRYQQAMKGFPSYLSYFHGLEIAPALGVLKTHYDSIESRYFIFYLQPNRSSINISSSPKYCPPASILLNKSDLSEVPDVFKYHQICGDDLERLCFYDNDYLCICQYNNHGVDCFLHDTQIDHCSKCYSNGKCVKNDKDFICLCPRCNQGDRCEFNMQAFGFTLDSLLVDDSKVVKIIYLSIMFVLFLIGLFNNLCSFVTFKRPTPRKFGVGNYLFIITCLNQISLLCLLIKLIEITFGIGSRNSCKIISYLFSVFTRLTYWLTSWVTIDRLLMIIFPTSIALKNPRLAIGISITTSLCLFIMHIHEIIYYTTIQHLSTNSLICVTNFDTHFISIYNRVSTLIHYILPFFIQIITITLLIVLAARSRTKTTGGKMTFHQVLIKNFRAQKELYITPIIIILSVLPQTILTFSLACTELTIWHRHLLLIAYLLSYAPQILGFILYVLPSSTYKKEFSETSFAKMSINWMFNEKKRTITVRKRK